MKSGYIHGHEAEKVAAGYLSKNGYLIKDLNWKTKYCEIDIVAEKDKRIYFVEVKYRQKSAWGGGFDYITPKKLEQMRFAAEMWVSNQQWHGEYQLAAVELSGVPAAVSNFLTDL